MKRGFTLVELSIVLVIIGLLIGGILAAQSMVSTAKMQKFVSQINSYDVALTNYNTKYKGIPADKRITGAEASYSNDGFVTNSNYYNNVASAELSLYWRELYIGTEFKDKCSDFNASFAAGIISNATSCNAPALIIGEKASIMVTGIPPIPAMAATAVQLVPSTRYKNIYMMANYTSMTGATFKYVNSFTAVEALAYDTKTDDGRANSGKVLAFADTSTADKVLYAYSGYLSSSYDTSVAGVNYYLSQEFPELGY